MKYVLLLVWLTSCARNPLVVTSNPCLKQYIETLAEYKMNELERTGYLQNTSLDIAQDSTLSYIKEKLLSLKNNPNSKYLIYCDPKTKYIRRKEH